MEIPSQGRINLRYQRPLKFLRLPHGDGMPMPTYANPQAVGMDVAAAESVVIHPGMTLMLSTGWAVELPADYELQVRSRSGLAAKHGVFVTNGPATIDPDYRGELKVVLTSAGDKFYRIERGDRIAQLVLAPVVRAAPVEVDGLSITDRGLGGFGSTGR